MARLKSAPDATGAIGLGACACGVSAMTASLEESTKPEVVQVRCVGSTPKLRDPDLSTKILQVEHPPRGGGGG